MSVEQRTSKVLTEEGLPDLSCLTCDFPSLLGIKEPLTAAPESYRTAFLKLCRDVHPDFHPAHLIEAEKVTSYLNQAWKTFNSRYQWLEYLILRMGGRCPQADKRTRQEVLIEMLELQEEIESSDDESRLTVIRNGANTRHQGLLDQAAIHMASSEYEQARLALNEASYHRTLMDLADSRRSS